MVNRFFTISLLVCGALVTSCANVGQYMPVPMYVQGVTNIDISEAFNVEEARRLMASGPFTLTGTAAMKLADGTQMKCSKSSVALIPATAYAAERMQHMFADRQGGVRTSTTILRFRPVEEEYGTLQRTTDCDENGQFRFEGVSAGTFYVVAIVNVFIGNQSTGGYVMERVEVNTNTNAKIVH